MGIEIVILQILYICLQIVTEIMESDLGKTFREWFNTNKPQVGN
jgi:hypothetical protein